MPVVATPAPRVAPEEDRLEREADRIADVAVQDRRAAPPLGRALKPAMSPITQAGGEGLDPATRAMAEARFRYDFSTVRVHADRRAAADAAGLGAQAFTYGSGIHFGAGRYDPASRDGLHLLVHELAHVVQQAETGPRLQRKGKPPTPVLIPFTVRITKVLTSEELLAEFATQYVAAAASLAVRKARAETHWHWEIAPPPVTPEDARKGYVLIKLADPSITPVGGDEKKAVEQYGASLAQPDQAAIDAAADKEFWAKSQYKVGQKLGDSPDDRRMREAWVAIRNELLRKRQAVEALPPQVRAFLFDEHATQVIAPEDYDKALRIAQKIADLSPAELAEYKSRTTARTDDWAAHEASIDRFLAEHQERAEIGKERLASETQLYGLDALYDRYRLYQSLEMSSTMNAALGESSPQAAGASIGSQPTINKMRTELTADLVAAGFPGGIPDFEALLHRYEAAFERETRALATVMLDQYAHTLWLQEERYRTTGDAAALHQAVEQSGARGDYERADAIGFASAMDPPTMAGADRRERGRQAADQAAARASGDAKVSAQAADHPLLGKSDFDREKVARSRTGDDTRQIMLDYIAARRQDIETTRQALRDKPTMIYGLDKLLEASYASQGIEPGSLRHKIIQARMSDVHWSEAIPQIVLTVVALAAGALTGGGGAVAVLAAGTAFGISAYQALDEFRRYETNSAAHGAQLTSDDPSIAWVVVAVIGAGIDAAGLAKALPALRGPIKAFEEGAEAGDLAKLNERLAGIDEKIRANVVRAAAERQEVVGAWKSVLKPDGRVYAMIVPYQDVALKFIYATYLTARQGIREFAVFVKSREAIALAGDVGKLSPAELAKFKSSYLQAIADMESAAAHGKSLGLTNNEVEEFLRISALRGRGTVEQTKAEMAAYSAAKQSGHAPDPLTAFAPGTKAEAETARTGGIRTIVKGNTDGQLTVTIEGEMRDPLYRGDGPAPAGKTKAPSFERGPDYARAKALEKPFADHLVELRTTPGMTAAEKAAVVAQAKLDAKTLAENYEAAHLWGPGFGDEAKAGIMFAPKHVNQELQNQLIEGEIRSLYQQVKEQGGVVSVRASAVAYGKDAVRAAGLPPGIPFLEHVEYTFTMKLPSGETKYARVTISATSPAASAKGLLEIHTPQALDVAH